MNAALTLWFIQIRKNGWYNMTVAELKEEGGVISIPGDLCLQMIRDRGLGFKEAK